MTIPGEFVDTVRSAHESMEKIAGFLDTYGSTPAAPAAAAAAPRTIEAAAPVADPGTTAGVGDGLTPEVMYQNFINQRMLKAEQRMAVARELRKRTTPELLYMLSVQGKEKRGIPLEIWLSAGTGRDASFGMLPTQVDPDIARAIDTSTASALIRQDLEPVLYELFVRTFPGFERFRREPANGLVHAWNQKTSYGDAQFMGELGTVTDDRSAYLRQTTNVAIVATRRGVSLKSLFGVRAGGAGYDLEGEEMTGGLQAIAHKVQYQIFSGHSTNAGGTASNEIGLYDPNAFTGFRDTFNTVRAKNADVLATTPDDLRHRINQACVEIMQQGGTASMLWGSPLDKEIYDSQQDKNVRWTNELVNVAVGVTTNVVNTVFGPLPYGVIPGDAIGTYVPTSLPGGWTNARDVYVLDERTITMPYLGAEGPTILDIPIGLSGQLTHLWIIFGMWGLAVKTPTFSNKVRVRAT